MTKSCPRILYLTDSWPYGKSFGGQLRALHIGRALKQVGSVTLMVVNSDDDDVDVVLQTAEEFDVKPSATVRLPGNRGLIQKLRRAFDSRFLNIHGCVASVEDQRRIATYLAEYDLIWLLNSRTPNILQRWYWPHSHLDVSDVPSTYLRAVSRDISAPCLRFKARAQQFLLKRRELLYKERFTTLSVCSEADRLYLGGNERIHVIPNGYERPSTKPLRAPVASAPRIGFIGLCSYGPNLEGANWFLKECWPAIRNAVPRIRFRLAGEGTTSFARQMAPDVDVLGWIDDPAAEISTWSAMIVPIRSGAGTRIKIAEAFSRKCPVVSTSVGAFGYDLENGRQLLLADTPQDFVAACTQLVLHQDQAAEMAERAWSEFLNRWTWDAIAPKVWAAAQDCLLRSKASQA